MNKWVKAGIFLVIIGIVTIVVSIVTGADTSFYWDRDGHFRSSREVSWEIEDLEDWDWHQGLPIRGQRSEVAFQWEGDFDEQEWTQLEKRFSDWQRWFAEGARSDREVSITSKN